MKNAFEKMVIVGLIGTVALMVFTACSLPVRKAKAGSAIVISNERSIESKIKAEKTGGWTPAEDATVTEDLEKVFEKATEGLMGVDYIPVSHLGTQLVAGINHCFLSKATAVYPGAAPHYALVYIYERFKGECEVLKIEDITLPGIENTDSKPVLGGWSFAEDPEVTADIASIVSKAATSKLGASYEAVAYIGSQAVNGTSHAVLCKISPVVPGAAVRYALVYINEAPDGCCSITDVTEIVISA